MQRIACRGGLEIRGEGLEQTLVGYAAVFHKRGDDSTEFELRPGFHEHIARGAFDNITRDVVSFYNHESDRLLGRMSSGTLRLSTDKKGLRFEVDLPPTSVGEEVAALTSRGDLNGASFGFKVRKDKMGENYRELQDIDLVEVSPVIMPAYEGTHLMLRCDDPEEEEERAWQQRAAAYRARKLLTIRAPNI